MENKSDVAGERGFCSALLQQCVYKNGYGGGEVLTSDIYANAIQCLGLVFLWYYCRGLQQGDNRSNRLKAAKKKLLPVYVMYIKCLIGITVFWLVFSMLGLFPTQLAGSGQINSEHSCD